ncbi:MAG: hypothetical protein ACPHRO_03080, partial [Nannocystaceae bacterium]
MTTSRTPKSSTSTPSVRTRFDGLGTPRGLLRAGIQLVCVAALWVGLMVSTSTQARLHAYYVVQDVGIGNSTPRIMFILDTSRSMAGRAVSGVEPCEWSECDEGGGSNQSRVAAARKAMNQIVQDFGSQATFALASFTRQDAPEKTSEIPDDCLGGSGGPRFQWVDLYQDRKPLMAYMNDYITDLMAAFGVGFVSGEWDTANMLGMLVPVYDLAALPNLTLPVRPSPADPLSGQWKLCGDNLPYPYIRADEVNMPFGVDAIVPETSLFDPSVAPPSYPLLTDAQLQDPNNANRKVQWFNRFLGVRVNLDSANLQDRKDFCQSFGDYGEGPALAKLGQCIDGSKIPASLGAGVIGYDFYYWPYVDGFPGYGSFASVDPIVCADVYTGKGPNPNCDNSDMADWADTFADICGDADYAGLPWCSSLVGSAVAQVGAVVRSAADTSAWDSPARMGVFADASDSAAVKRTIFAPFYQPGLPALIADGTVKYGDEVWYPASAEEAEETILSLTSATAEGGIDAMGPTEWERVIG